MWRRAFILGATALLLIYGWYYWYFRVVVHHKYVSPQERCFVTVTKRAERFPEPLEVRLQIGENWKPYRILLETLIDVVDSWEEVKEDSYELQWQSEEEFVVRGREPHAGFVLRGKYHNGHWLVERLQGPE